MRSHQEVLDIVNALPAIATVRNAAVSVPMPIYVTGSGLRDLFLGRPAREFDFIVGDDADRLAHEVAAIEPGGMLDVDLESGAARYRTRTLGNLQFLPSRGLSAEQYLTQFGDFTVNAAVFDLQAGAIMDCHGALADLEEQRVRSVSPDGLIGKPAHFPLRAIRLALLTPAFALDDETRAAVERQAPLVERAEPADVGLELLEILCCPEYSRGLTLLGELGLLHAALRNAFLFAVPAETRDDDEREMVDVDEVIRLFTLHDSLSQPYADRMFRHIPVMRQVLLLTAALRKRGLNVGGDEGQQFLKTHGNRIERRFGDLSAHYSAPGIFAFRVRMVTVGYWLGLAALAHGASLDEALALPVHLLGTYKGLLSTMLIGADWLAGHRDEAGERVERVRESLQRLVLHGPPVPTEERRPC